MAKASKKTTTETKSPVTVRLENLENRFKSEISYQQRSIEALEHELVRLSKKMSTEVSSGEYYYVFGSNKAETPEERNTKTVARIREIGKEIALREEVLSFLRITKQDLEWTTHLSTGGKGTTLNIVV
jgi:hypothetical protein